VKIGPVLKPYHLDRSVHPLARPDVVRLSIVLLLIRLTGILGAPETAYDDLYLHFEYLLNISQEVIDYETAYVELNPGTEVSSYLILLVN